MTHICPIYDRYKNASMDQRTKAKTKAPKDWDEQMAEWAKDFTGQEAADHTRERKKLDDFIASEAEKAQWFRDIATGVKKIEHVEIKIDGVCVGSGKSIAKALQHKTKNVRASAKKEYFISSARAEQAREDANEVTSAEVDKCIAEEKEQKRQAEEQKRQADEKRKAEEHPEQPPAKRQRFDEPAVPGTKPKKERVSQDIPSMRAGLRTLTASKLHGKSFGDVRKMLGWKPKTQLATFLLAVKHFSNLSYVTPLKNCGAGMCVVAGYKPAPAAPAAPISEHISSERVFVPARIRERVVVKDYRHAEGDLAGEMVWEEDPLKTPLKTP